MEGSLLSRKLKHPSSAERTITLSARLRLFPALLSFSLRIKLDSLPPSLQTQGVPACRRFKWITWPLQPLHFIGGWKNRS